MEMIFANSDRRRVISCHIRSGQVGEFGYESNACVMGKCVNNPHYKQKKEEEDRVSTVSIDYGFMHSELEGEEACLRQEVQLFCLLP